MRKIVNLSENCMLGEKVDVTLFLALGSGPWEEFAPDGYRL